MVRLGTWQDAQPTSWNTSRPRLIRAICVAGQRWFEQAERVQLEQRRRPRLRREIDRERRLIADRHLVRHAVGVAVDVVADDLHRLHAELVV